MSEVSKIETHNIGSIADNFISTIVGGQPTEDSATTDDRGCSLGATLSKRKENFNFCISTIKKAINL